jgi:uncharacterized cupredoxin-like copper-binding protein
MAGATRGLERVRATLTGLAAFGMAGVVAAAVAGWSFPVEAGPGHAQDGHAQDGHAQDGHAQDGPARDGHGHAGLEGGRPGEAADVDRTIEVEAGDIYFDREVIEVRPGETIRFVVRNTGETLHDFTIGTAAAQARHRQEMTAMMDAGHLDMDAGEHGADHAAMDHDQMHAVMHGRSEGRGHGPGAMVHDDPNAVVVAPGATGELIWTFEEARDLQFGCNVPGHYESGMHGAFRFGR